MKPQIFAADKEKALARQLRQQTQSDKDLKLAGKIILITGATQGIGQTLAITAATAGAQTLLLDKSIPALETLYEDIMAISDTVLEPFLLPVDMAGANLDDYLAIAETLATEITHVDGIIHNAAHFAGLYALMQTPPEDLIKHIHVNYTAPIWLTQALFELLKQSPEPTLLFADHAESHDEEVAYYNTYAGSKLALMQAVKQLALEHESIDLYAYGYNTGWVNTVLARQVFPHGSDDWTRAEDSGLSAKILTLFQRTHPNGSVVSLNDRDKPI